MADAQAQRLQQIASALDSANQQSLPLAVAGLLKTLGYRSDKTIDFAVCFLAGGQILPATLAVPACPAITAARPKTPLAARAKTTGIRFMVRYFPEAGTRRMTMPGVDAASPSPVPAPVGFCSST